MKEEEVTKIIGAVFANLIILAIVFFIGYCISYDKGYKQGYISALDDARLGNTPKYKLVETAKIWVKNVQ